MKFIKENVPGAGGHYSQAVVANGFVFVAGQLPIAADGSIPEGIEVQTRLVLGRISTILEAAGSRLDRIVSTTVYVSDINFWPQVDRAYAEVLGDHRPARTVAVSPQLHYGASIEMTVIALA